MEKKNQIRSELVTSSEFPPRRNRKKRGKRGKRGKELQNPIMPTWTQ